jgi:SAM-dependent methyltransferase
MKRTPEPELMDDREQTEAYAQADFSTTDRAFAARFVELFGSGATDVLDIGCGPGNILLQLAPLLPKAELTGVDGAPNMLRLAADATAGTEFARRVTWKIVELPADKLPRRGFDAIVSNSLLHHLHEPSVLWDTVRHCGKAGAAVFIGDLRRPADADEALKIQALYASDAPKVLQHDFLASLHAAFEPDEVRAQLAAAGLGMLEVVAVGDRHLHVIGRLPPS